MTLKNCLGALMEIDFNDPLVLGGIALGLALLLVLFLLVFATAEQRGGRHGQRSRWPIRC